MPKVSQEHIDARRQTILEGARRCFAEFGYEGATVRRLEEATGLSRGAIFHHFRDKDALFLVLATEDAEKMADVAATSGIVQVMRDLIADPESFPWLGTRLEIARRLRTDAEFRERWSEQQAMLDEAVRARLQAKKATGRMRTDLPDEVLHTYLDVVLDGLITRLASGQSTRNLDEVLDLVESSVRTR